MAYLTTKSQDVERLRRGRDQLVLVVKISTPKWS